MRTKQVSWSLAAGFMMLGLVSIGPARGLATETSQETSAREVLGEKGLACCSKYDLRSEFTFDGVVEEIKSADPGRMKGARLIVRSDEAFYEVHLAPQQYMENEKISFDVGGEVTVVAAPMADEKPEPDDSGRLLLQVVARQIERGEMTLVFRDDKGSPLWKGGKRGRHP